MPANKVSFALHSCCWGRNHWHHHRLNTQISGITGPRAPHSFILVQRQHLAEHLESGDTATSNIDESAHVVKHGEDVMCVIKHHMRDKLAEQICMVLPAGITNRLPSIPETIQARKIIPLDFQRDVCRKALKVKEHGNISSTAHVFLTQWVTGALRRHPKPSDYPWLRHRWHQSSHVRRHAQPYDAVEYMSRMVVKSIPPSHDAHDDGPADAVDHASVSGDDADADFAITASSNCV